MTKTDTIGRVPRPRGTLSDETLIRLASLKGHLQEADRVWREWVIEALKEGSFSEVSRATGLSKDTLQRWKREAGR